MNTSLGHGDVNWIKSTRDSSDQDSLSHLDGLRNLSLLNLLYINDNEPQVMLYVVGSCVVVHNWAVELAHQCPVSDGRADVGSMRRTPITEAYLRQARPSVRNNIYCPPRLSIA